MCIWIKNFSSIAQPLVDLTCKGASFMWQEEHKQAMLSLKNAIIHSSALISINYSADRAVYLSVDSSIRGVGWILMQDCSDGCCCPVRFGSISWNEHESCYSQVKLKLYRLFCALHAMHLYLIGICNLVIKVNTSYIRGMLSNPNVQPNAAILLFDFKLVHVPANKHKGPDSLSRCKQAPGEDEDDNPKDWVDGALSLGIWVVSWLDTFPTDTYCTDTLMLSLKTPDDDDDFILYPRPHHDCRLPVRFHMGEFISMDISRAHSRLRLVNAPCPTPSFNTEETNHNIIPNISSTDNIDNDSSTNHNNNDNSTHILPTFNYLNNNHIEDLTPIKFPANDNASKADAEMDWIRQYLLSHHTPPDLPADALTHFISRAQHFLITGGQ